MSRSAQQVFRSILELDLRNATVCVCLASYVGQSQSPSFASLNMTGDLADDFKDIVKRTLERLREDNEAGNLTLMAYDAGYKPDSHEVEWVKSAESTEVVETLQVIPDPIANATLFQASEEFIRGLHFYAIIVERRNHERTIFMRKYDPKKELSRSKWLAALLSGGQYDRVRVPAFLFDDQIDCICSEGFVYSLRKHDFQQVFGFFARLRENARVCLRQIAAQVPIANFDEFAESCQSHLIKLAKLNNIAAKPYLRTVTMEDLKRTIAHFSLRVEVVEHDGVEKLRFDPAERWLILKLLDDDYLGSVMTNLQYEVNSKREV